MTIRFWDLVRESKRDHDACVECGTRLEDDRHCPDWRDHPSVQGYHHHIPDDDMPSRAEAEGEFR